MWIPVLFLILFVIWILVTYWQLILTVLVIWVFVSHMRRVAAVTTLSDRRKPVQARPVAKPVQTRPRPGTVQTRPKPTSNKPVREMPVPQYLPRWNENRRLDTGREHAQWQKNFDDAAQ